MQGCDGLQAAEGKAPVIDPAAAKKAAEEAEERRLAEIRALGTPVTPDTFNAWKTTFYTESALARTRSCHLVPAHNPRPLPPQHQSSRCSCSVSDFTPSRSLCNKHDRQALGSYGSSAYLVPDPEVLLV